MLISQHGFGGMGVIELLQTADVSRGSLYHHHESKEGLGLQLLRECFDVCFAGLRGLEDVPQLDSFIFYRSASERLLHRNTRDALACLVFFYAMFTDATGSRVTERAARKASTAATPSNAALNSKVAR